MNIPSGPSRKMRPDHRERLTRRLPASAGTNSHPYWDLRARATERCMTLSYRVHFIGVVLSRWIPMETVSSDSIIRLILAVWNRYQ